jgi:transposase
MTERLTNLSTLSHSEKDSLIGRLFDELDHFRGVVEDLQARVAVLESENQSLRTENETLRSKVKDLEGKLAKNSHNSSKPPSTDGYQKPQPKSLRKPSGKPTGGQKGHPGTRLKKVAQPDHILIHPVESCQQCGSGLFHIAPQPARSRQVYDIPPVKMEVTEHQTETRCCPGCGHQTESSFPPDVKTEVQYGSRIRSFLLYLNQYQMLPYGRTCQLASDLFKQQISQGTLKNWIVQCFDNLEQTETQIRQAIIASPVVHFDETGIRQQGKLHWLHAASTETLTFYGLHAKRGQVAMQELGILENFTGNAVHDHWKSYFRFGCQHSLCNAHHLRELTYLVEHEEQTWAQSLIELLLEAKQTSEANSNNCVAAESSAAISISDRYDTLIEIGLAQNLPPPAPPPTKKKRGRRKQSKAKNLLDRLRDFKENTLAFLHHPQIPFDNNLGERDMRMAKLKQKVSGCFRSSEGGQYFARIRGYISTLRKNNQSILSSIESAYEKSPDINDILKTAE